MLSREQVQAALRPVAEPITKQSLVELGWIRDIMVKEERISLTVVSANQDESSKAEIEVNVRNLLTAAGANNIHIRFREASDHEKNELGLTSPQPEQEQPFRGRGEGLESVALLDPASQVSFIAVASGKGGVGKSTVTVNLAAALARAGKRVGLIDADIYGFSVPDMMGIEEIPVVIDGLIKPVERFGVKVMSMGFFIQENSPVIWRGPMLGKMLRQFLGDVNWGDLDYLLLDLPPGTGDIALDIHQMLPQSKEIIVTTPHATAAFVAARAGAMAVQTNHEILGVVENMAYYESAGGERDYVFGRGGGPRLAETLHTELLAQIPLGAPDNHLSEADYSPSIYKDNSNAGQMYNAMAQQIIDKCEQKG
ncbi:ATP-binding protein involved in chromosome partitioning [Paenibacillus shirakamiensis]|uniref:Iron-sulfur cluster carrier protein n=1 Tax=Paenibacillus shirakamiensis TaxID=1265935 RepID=A0ABS4JLT2_9BACL|nr:Mrp/NBP35 family ATP-binding protein [Paenibacillus shirakamiensis]MBP2002672.1 ATP-binding protein involved in chromosome partitioning [Paenibacillus shirakamiensis]